MEKGNHRKRLRMWGRAAAKYRLSPTEVQMGLKIGISWRRLGRKKNEAEGIGLTLGEFLRMRYQQECGKGASIQVKEHVAATVTKQNEWLRSQREASAHGLERKASKVAPENRVSGEPVKTADGTLNGLSERHHLG